MKNKKFIEIAACLGIAVPTCLIGLAQECEASNAKASVPECKIELGLTPSESNPIKERIIDLLKANSDDSSYQELAHTNVHANYTVPHTNVHSNYKSGKYYCDEHSNTPKKHVDHHSNHRV